MNIHYRVEKEIGGHRFLFCRGYEKYERAGQRVKVEVHHWRTVWGEEDERWGYYGTWGTVRAATAEIKRNVVRGAFER